MAAVLCDVVIVVGRTRLRSMPLARLTMKKGLHGFHFISMHAYGSNPIVMVLRLATLRAAGTPAINYGCSLRQE